MGMLEASAHVIQIYDSKHLVLMVFMAELCATGLWYLQKVFLSSVSAQLRTYARGLHRKNRLQKTTEQQISHGNATTTTGKCLLIKILLVKDTCHSVM